MPGDNESVIRENTRELTEMKGSIRVVERALTELEESINDRMLRLESAMQSSNAHLDNIARESSRTNELLEEELRIRRERDERREEQEREDRKERRDDRKETKNLVVGAAREVWEISKQPFAYLIAAAVAYFAWAWLQQSNPNAASVDTVARPVPVAPYRAAPAEGDDYPPQ